MFIFNSFEKIWVTMTKYLDACIWIRNFNDIVLGVSATFSEEISKHYFSKLIHRETMS